MDQVSCTLWFGLAHLWQGRFSWTKGDESRSLDADAEDGKKGLLKFMPGKALKPESTNLFHPVPRFGGQNERLCDDVHPFVFEAQDDVDGASKGQYSFGEMNCLCTHTDCSPDDTIVGDGLLLSTLSSSFRISIDKGFSLDKNAESAGYEHNGILPG